MNNISEGYGVDQTAAGSDWSEPAVSVRPSRLGRQARADHAQFIGRRPDGNGPASQGGMSAGVHAWLAVEEDPLHGRVPDNPGAMLVGRAGDGIEVLTETGRGYPVLPGPGENS